MNNIKYNITAGSSLWLLLFVSIIGYILVGLVGLFLPSDNATLALRIGSVFQQVFAFIAPAIVCALISTRRPDIMLRLRGKIHSKALLWTIVVMIVSMPAMEALVQLNDAMPMPEPLYNFFRTIEDSAAQVTETMIGGHTVGNLIVNLLIMAVMTGFSEEILFRGALTGTLARTRLGMAGGIWVGAIIFSLMHMQMFGFFPRMLLGAFFGYLMFWSGSIWLCVIAHAINNGLYIIAKHLGYDEATVEQTSISIIIVAISIVLTIYSINQLRCATLEPKEPQDNA